VIKGKINKIIPFSAIDGPGNRTVIFLQGCNLNCLYCHNPETINFCNNCSDCIEVCEVNALSLQSDNIAWDSQVCTNCDKCIDVCSSKSSPKVSELTVEELFEEISKYKLVTSGITIAGGECTVQYDFLLSLLKEAKKQNISAFIDTNGHLSLGKMKQLSLYFDKVMLDIKSHNSEEHKKLTGKDNKLVLKNAEFLLSTNKIHEIRTVITPSLLDNENNVQQISKLISKQDKSVTYKLLKYRSNGVLNKEISYQPKDSLMKKLQLIAKNTGCENVVVL